MMMAPPQSAVGAPFASCGGASVSWENKANMFGSRESTMFLVDYDDTVLASSWLAAQGIRLDATSLPDEVLRQLEVLEQHAVALLSRTIELGHVALVTNAEDGWIELSARKFLPRLVPLLEKVRVISARTLFEKEFPNKTQMWKNAAYDMVFAEVFGDILRAGFTGTFNVLSLGDSLYERNALLNLASKVQNARGKSIKLIERPTVEQLQRQLQILYQNIDYLSSTQDAIDLMLTVENFEC